MPMVYSCGLDDLIQLSQNVTNNSEAIYTNKYTFIHYLQDPALAKVMD